MSTIHYKEVPDLVGNCSTTDDPTKVTCGSCQEWIQRQKDKKESTVKELTVTEDCVKKAAETCPDAKRVLAELFPDVFKPRGPQYATSAHAGQFERRTSGNFKDKGWFLLDFAPEGKIQWGVTLDNQGYQVLVGVIQK